MFDVEPVLLTHLVGASGLTTLHIVPDEGRFAERVGPATKASPALTAAVEGLAAANVPSTRSLTDLLVVLTESVPTDRTIAAEPFTPGPAPPRRPAATAAHPRGYDGTKHKPPKRPARQPRDLRAWLTSPADLSRILACHDAVHWTEARRALGALGHDDDAIDCALVVLDELPALPVGFVRTLLPSLRGVSRSTLRAIAARYRALGLDEEPTLRAALARLLARGAAHDALGWCDWLQQVPAERRHLSFKIVALTTGAARLQPTDLPSVEGPAGRFDVALRWLIRGAPASFVRSGLALADVFAPDHVFRDEDLPGRGDPDFDEGLVADVAAALGAPWDRHGPLAIWEACGASPGLGRAIATLARSGLPSAVQARAIQLYTTLRHEEPRPDKVEALVAEAPTLVRFLRELDEPRALASLQQLDECCSTFATAEHVRARLPAIMELVARQVRDRAGPFDGHGLEGLVVGLGARVAEALEAGDESFRALHASCRRKNDAWLLSMGLAELGRAQPTLVSEAWRRHPTKLLRAAAVLGVLGRPWARATARKLVLPTLEGVLDRTTDLRRAGRTNPIPRRLRDHREGRVALRPGQVERHQRVVAERLCIVALDDVVAAALRELRTSASFEPAGTAQLHALSIVGWVQENRRPLRRLLQDPRTLEGDDAYLFTHPATRAWLERHPLLAERLATWRSGVTLDTSVEGFGPVALETASDPLEVLRMGTYVGSCLGLGGGLAYSAAAAALDANKRVVYARDVEGRVLGRQLVAYSEDDDLVCFTPYPLGMSPGIRELFAAYDARWSEALGVPLRAADRSDYVIADILSHGFWDDGAWDPVTTVNRQSLVGM
ncbi:MAG: hypothetical protein IPJ34_26845 [Myxococcales bacterium]|nr:hypothetical protein [Myxococcales bacterium]